MGSRNPERYTSPPERHTHRTLGQMKAAGWRLATWCMGNLLKATPPTKDQDITSRLDGAITRFQRYGSSIDDRRHAVRDLADILEKLRPQAKEVLTKKGTYIRM